MKKLKLKKYPKAPKKSASLAVKQNYLVKCREVDMYNAGQKKEAREHEMLDKKIAGISTGRKLASPVRRKKKPSTAKKTKSRKTKKGRK